MKKIVGKDNPNEILTIRLEELEDLYQTLEKDLSMEKQIDVRKFMSEIQEISIKGNFDTYSTAKRNEYIERLRQYILLLEGSMKL